MVRVARIRDLGARHGPGRFHARSGGGRLGLLRVLALYWYPKGLDVRLAVRRHLHALDGPGTSVVYHNAIAPAPPWVAWSAPQLCLLHPTFLGLRWDENFEDYRNRFRWVSELGCPKIALPQDEYDHPALLEEWLAELGVTSVYSCFGPDERAILYPTLQSSLPFRETLTGFIDQAAASAIAPRLLPHAERPADIVYRATKLPYWFGSHGQLKHRLAEVVGQRASELGLRTDISARWEDTIYGDDWLDFLQSGSAVIGCESGSSVLDVRGETQRRIRELLDEQPALTFEEVDREMPAGWDSYSFFAISPRHLEAVITKTAQLLVEGTYDGILEPERHYIPLRRDFANLDEALERLRDVEAVEAMAERAYSEVYLEGRNTLEDFAGGLRAESGRRARRVAVPFALATRLPARAVPESVTRWNPLQTRGGRRALLMLTLLEGLAREPGSRTLLLAAVRGTVRLPLRAVVWDVILLRVLSRIREAGRRSGWSLSAENAAGTVVVRTRLGSRSGSVDVGGPFERVVWDSGPGATVPLYPRKPWRASVLVGPDGRHEFRLLARDTGASPTLTRAILERTLAP